MALDVIGAGFGRTGTMSLKLALEQLGFNKCYHMVEVFQNPADAQVWLDATLGKPVDWEALFTGYRAAVDWPPCHFWREYADMYAEAKVILSVRSAESWFESASQTIFRAMDMELKDDTPAEVRAQREMARALVVEKTFGGSVADAEHCKRIFEEHNARVQGSIPAERLLVFEAGQGWEPLCAFLGVPVPDTPYPKSNTRDEFLAHFADRVKSD